MTNLATVNIHTENHATKSCLINSERALKPGTTCALITGIPSSMRDTDRVTFVQRRVSVVT